MGLLSYSFVYTLVPFDRSSKVSFTFLLILVRDERFGKFYNVPNKIFVKKCVCVAETRDV
jgi:hypothetical protein